MCGVRVCVCERKKEKEGSMNPIVKEKSETEKEDRKVKSERG